MSYTVKPLNVLFYSYVVVFIFGMSLLTSLDPETVPVTRT